MKKKAWVLNLDVLPYEEAQKLQENLVVNRSKGKIEDIFILLEHPPVITIPTEKALENIIVPLDKLRKEGISICKTNRGGDVTYHGPGQLVGYPILDLKNHGRDLHKYVHNIEKVIIGLLRRDYNISAQRDSQHPGVWVKNKKIAAIGIAVKFTWVSMHGFSLNVDPNLDHFSFIIPCGIKDRGITSLAKVLGTTVNKLKLRQQLIRHLSDIFNLDIKEITLEDIPWQ